MNIMCKGSMMMNTKDKKKVHAAPAKSNEKHGHMSLEWKEGKESCNLESHVKEVSLSKKH